MTDAVHIQPGPPDNILTLQNPKIRRRSTFFHSFSFVFLFSLLPPFCLSPLSLVGRISFPATPGAKRKRRESLRQSDLPGMQREVEGRGLGNSLTTLISAVFILHTRQEKKKNKERKKKSCDLTQPPVIDGGDGVNFKCRVRARRDGWTAE